MGGLRGVVEVVGVVEVGGIVGVVGERDVGRI